MLPFRKLLSSVLGRRCDSTVANNGGAFGAERIDLDKGAPQSDIFGEYKEALRRAVAEDLVRREAERRIKKGLVAL